MDLLSGPVMFRFLITHEPVDAGFSGASATSWWTASSGAAAGSRRSR